jgi:hypothetical protein
MQLEQFFDLIEEMMEGQKITGEIGQLAKEESRELTEQEKRQFGRLFIIETAVRQWLPKFMCGISCVNCKHNKDCEELCCKDFEPIEL